MQRLELRTAMEEPDDWMYVQSVFQKRRGRAVCARKINGSPDLYEPFTFQHGSHIFESSSDVSGWKPDLAEALDVGKLRTAFLQQNDRPSEAKPALKPTSLVNDVHTRMLATISMFIFCGHDNQSKSAASSISDRRLTFVVPATGTWLNSS